jgi:hypothetical protein
MKRTTTFTHGSGVYACRCCGRKTRDDGNGDSVNVMSCTQCYELAGIENEIADCGATPERLAEVEALKTEIRAKGGVLK